MSVWWSSRDEVVLSVRSYVQILGDIIFFWFLDFSETVNGGGRFKAVASVNGIDGYGVRLRKARLINGGLLT